MSKSEDTAKSLERLGLFSAVIDAITGSQGSKKTINSIASEIRQSEMERNRVVFELRYPNAVAGDLFINETRVAKTSYGSLTNQIVEIIGEHSDGDFIDLDSLRHNRNTHTILNELVPDKTFRNLFFPQIKNNGFYLRTKITQQNIDESCSLTVEQLNEILLKIAK